jgi:hypothetical protein
MKIVFIEVRTTRRSAVERRYVRPVLIFTHPGPVCALLRCVPYAVSKLINLKRRDAGSFLLLFVVLIPAAAELWLEVWVACAPLA